MIAFLRAIPFWLWMAIAAVAGIGYLLVTLENTQEELQQKSQALEQEQVKSASLTQTLTLQRQLYKDTQAVNDAYDSQTRELQAQNDSLARDIAAGNKRLHVNATCVPSTTRDTTAQPSAHDATPRLDATAQRDYLDLRAGLEQQRAQIVGLQTYITSVCLKGQAQ